MTEIHARDYRDPDDVIVASGQLLAGRVIELLRKEPRVRVHLRNMPGLSSSYFNIFIKRIAEEVGPDAPDRVEFDFASPLQANVYARSLDAFRATTSVGR